MVVDPAALRHLGAAIYARLGVPEADVALIADSLVQADLWGHQSHGVMRLPWYARRLQSGVMRSVTAPSTVVGAGAGLAGRDDRQESGLTRRPRRNANGRDL